MENNIKTSLAPRYIGLDYIQCTKTQYIDTNFHVDKNTRIYAKFKMISSYNNNFLFGVTPSNGIQYLFSLYTTAFVSRLGTTFLQQPPSDLNEHILDFNNNSKLILDGISYSLTNNYTGSISLYLFADNDSGTATRYGNNNLYFLQIFDNQNTLVRDYIPVKRYSDDAVGLYDKVENKFYENGGTGSFIAGNLNSKNNIY